MQKVDCSAMKFAKKKWLAKPEVSGDPECKLQEYTDTKLKELGMLWFRINEGFMEWVKNSAPYGTWDWFRKMFIGYPDNTVFIPISDKYSLCVHLELKSSKGKLHGKQKIVSKQVPYQIARTNAEVDSILKTAMNDAKHIGLNLIAESFTKE